jgi:hypothetical protein
MIAARRHGKMRSLIVLLGGAVLLATPALATDLPASSRASADVAIEVVPHAEPAPPLSPPPGMSVTPPEPMMRPAPEDQAHGCPVKDLKPLDLLV